MSSGPTVLVWKTSIICCPPVSTSEPGGFTAALLMSRFRLPFFSWLPTTFAASVMLAWLVVSDSVELLSLTPCYQRCAWKILCYENNGFAQPPQYLQSHISQWGISTLFSIWISWTLHRLKELSNHARFSTASCLAELCSIHTWIISVAQKYKYLAQLFEEGGESYPAPQWLPVAGACVPVLSKAAIINDHHDKLSL